MKMIITTTMIQRQLACMIANDTFPSCQNKCTTDVSMIRCVNNITETLPNAKKQNQSTMISTHIGKQQNKLTWLFEKRCVLFVIGRWNDDCDYVWNMVHIALYFTYWIALFVGLYFLGNVLDHQEDLRVEHRIMWNQYPSE